MMNSERKRTCFVIMPFGEKKDLDNRDIDFDDIYRFFLKKIIEEAGLVCVRCDEIEEAGSLHEKMFERIYMSDVVVVDITTSNANVYYELGVRHTLSKGVTVLIRRKGTTIPFNIQGLQVVEYDPTSFGSIERAKARIQQIIKHGLNQRLIDSPIHSVLELNIEPEAKPIQQTDVYEARVMKQPDNILSNMTIGLITGDIQNVKGIDVWVNSENTNMQMGRPFENSISGVIRYLGALKDGVRIEDDRIFEELRVRMNKETAVPPGSILVTSSGEMWKTHQVKLIFHAASVIGEVGTGYTPILNVTQCVVSSLEMPIDRKDDIDGIFKELKQCDREIKDSTIASILFPLFGSRSSRRLSPEQRVKPLLDAAINHLCRQSKHTFSKVYFLTYTDKEFEACRGLLKADPRLGDLNHVPSSKGDASGEVQVTEHPALTASSSEVVTIPPLVYTPRSPTSEANHSTRKPPKAK